MRLANHGLGMYTLKVCNSLAGAPLYPYLDLPLRTASTPKAVLWGIAANGR